MYRIKNQIYQEMTKTQKSALCNFLRALVKKSPQFSVEDILDKFLEDEKYYLEINNPHFEFLQNYLDDNKFLDETLLYLEECRKYYDYKKKQEPLIQAQKEFEKKKRNFLKEVKMSKETPTKKQLYYYDRLCKKYNIEKKELTSKLEARNEIESILNEYSRDFENIDR
ncbi:unknown [Fusobacterium sp. CAG:439]|nr:unknown [Fusobacterium sp. CAG:439]